MMDCPEREPRTSSCMDTMLFVISRSLWIDKGNIIYLPRLSKSFQVVVVSFLTDADAFLPLY
jgi:hypothetical protein